jgi:hypothetical protein
MNGATWQTSKGADKGRARRRSHFRSQIKSLIAPCRLQNLIYRQAKADYVPQH